jgi:hypothetical protein
MIGAQTTQQVPWLQATLQPTKALTSLTNPLRSSDTRLSLISSSCLKIQEIIMITRPSSSPTKASQACTIHKLSTLSHRAIITPWHSRIFCRAIRLICRGPRLRRLGTELL